VLDTDAGNVVIRAGVIRPFTDGSDALGEDAFRWNTAYLKTFVNLQETSDPAAPGSNEVRLYAKDNGAGKTQLVARFATGAVQTIATEP